MLQKALRFLSIAVLMCALPAAAEVPAPEWAITYSGYNSSSSTIPQAARMLPDGSFMVAGDASAKGFATRGMAAELWGGVEPKSTAYFGEFTAEYYAIGPAGEVFLQRSGSGGGVVVMKYDGYTGRKGWSAPVILNPTESASPRGLAVGSNGDLYAATKAAAGAVHVSRIDGVDGELVWSTSYDTVANDEPKGIQALPGGGAVIVVDQGSNYFTTLAFNFVTGTVAWSDAFSGTNVRPYVLSMAPDGSILVGGAAFISPTSDALVIKYSPAGARVWVRTFDASATNSASARLLVGDAGGDVFVAGATQDSVNPARWLVARLDASDGGIVWATSYGGSSSENAVVGGVIDGDGHFTVSGTYGDSFYNHSVVKFRNANGSHAWESRGTQHSPRQLVLHPNGDVFTFGYGNGSAAEVIRITGAAGTRYSPAGLASASYQGNPPEKIVHDAAGDVYFVQEYGMWDPTLLTKVSSTGILLWSQTLGMSGASDIEVDPSGNVVVAGYEYSYPNVARLEKRSGATGDELWRARVPVAGRDTGFERIAIDTAGNVFATGAVGDSYSASDVLIAALSTAGSSLWPHIVYDGGASERGVDVVLDSLGRVVVAGMTSGPENRALLLRYDSATGTPIGTPVIGTLSGAFLKEAVADESGNVFVSGELYDGSVHPSGAYSAYLLMMNGSGAVAWEKTFESATPSVFAFMCRTDLGVAVVVSKHEPSSTLVSYDSSGTLLWTRSIEFGERTYLQSPVFAGSAIVLAGMAGKQTGYSDDLSVFAKYDQSTGEEQWRGTRDNGSSNDGAYSVDVAGDVIYLGMFAGERGMIAKYVSSTAIEQLDGDLPVAYCGTAYAYGMIARNCSGSCSWSVSDGSLPPGLSLSTAGDISGTPTVPGVYEFTLAVADSTGTATRKFSFDVAGSSAHVPVVASPDPLCQGNASLLSLGLTYSSHDWLPDHQNSSRIDVSPQHPTIFGVSLDAALGCPTFGSTIVDVLPLLSEVAVTISGSSTVCEGSTAGTLTVFDTGGGRRTHQWWYRSGSGTPVAIPGETGRTYRIEAADLPGPGSYEIFCVTTPQCGPAMESNPINVTYPGLTPPGTLTATAMAPDSLTLSWNPGGGAHLDHYNIYRSSGFCPGGAYVKVGESAGSATTFLDTTAVDGGTYSYVVASASAGNACESTRTACASAVAYGDCAVPPNFDGLASVSVSGCVVRLSWYPAVSACPSARDLTYSVFRSTNATFSPDASTLLATCVPRTQFDDETATAGTTHYYIVRAEDGTTGHGGPCGGGNADANTVRRSATPTTSVLWSPIFQDSFESPRRPDNPAAYWTESPTDPNLAGISTCESFSAPASYRLGPQSSCTSAYAPATPRRQDLILGPAAGFALPAAPLRMRFRKTFSFYIWMSVALFYKTDDMTDYAHVGDTVSATAPYIVSGGYNGTTTRDGVTYRSWGYPWSSGYWGWTETVVNLDVLAGKRVWFRWTLESMEWEKYRGFFMDDVSIESGVTTACSTNPAPIPAISATSTNGATKLEFVTGSVNYAQTVARYRTDGTYPTDPFDGYNAGSYVGLPGTYGSIVHSGEANDTTHLYSVFVDNGAGRWSPVKTIRSRPQSTAGMVKWIYNTGATAMTPPGILGGATGRSFVASNDRTFHGVMTGATGGVWPAGWLPLAMNAPSQSRTLPLEIPIGGVTRRVVLVGSQDGRVYCVDANTGSFIWDSDVLGEMVQGSPSAISTVYGAPFSLVFAASRDTTAGSKVYALNPDNGDIVWTFDNSVSVGGDGEPIGVINDGVIFRYAAEASGKRRAFFASRKWSATSSTLWAVEFDATSVTKSWSVDAGPIDGFPYPGATTLWVGTIDGKVTAVRASDGAFEWAAPIETKDGGVKVTVWPDTASGRLYFSTTNYLWSAGTDGTIKWKKQLASPSTPNRLGARLYVGAGDGRLYQIGNLLVADPALLDVKSVILGDPASPGYVGDTTIDRTNSLIYVGTGNGAVYAVAYPLP